MPHCTPSGLVHEMSLVLNYKALCHNGSWSNLGSISPNLLHQANDTVKNANLPTIEQLNSSFNINQFRVQNIKSHLPFAKFNFPEKAFLLCKRWWNLDFLQISLLEGFANDKHSTFWRSSLLLLLQIVLLSFALKNEICSCFNVDKFPNAMIIILDEQWEVMWSKGVAS